MNGNKLNCSKKSVALYDWLYNNSNYPKRIKADCSDNSSIWEHDWGKCNENGEYNGTYDIDYWPPVPPGEISVVNCTSGEGRLLWLCKRTGFENKGPTIETCSEGESCLFDNLICQHINDKTMANEILKNLNEKLANKKLVNFGSLNKILHIFEKLEKFLQKQVFQEPFAESLTRLIVQSFSRILHQSNAWENGTDIEKREIASKILLLIHRTSFTTNCFLNSQKSSKEYSSRNLYQKLFFNYSKNKIHSLEHNFTSLTLPRIYQTDQDYFCGNHSSLGIIIHNINNYLSEGLQKKSTNE